MAEVVPFRRPTGGSNELSDETLIAALALGDRAALGNLFDRHQQKVRSFLHHLVGADDVDDLLQTTFELVHKNARRFQGRSQVRTWILGIAKNVARHQVRTRIRRPLISLERVASPVDPTPAVDERIQDERQLAALHRAIQALSPKLREVFVLVYVEGLSGTEAAQALELGESAVWKRLHEARKKLRAAMGELG